MRDEDRPVFVMMNGFIHYIKNDDKSIYNACPDETCRRKVVFKENTQRWRWDKCDTEYEKCVPTYVLVVKMADFSGGIYVHFYRDLAKAIMDIEPGDLQKIKDDGFTQEYNGVFYRNWFKNIKLLMKIRMYRGPDGATKINYHASRVLDHSFKDENDILLDRLERYADKPDIYKETEEEQEGISKVEVEQIKIKQEDENQIKAQVKQKDDDVFWGIPMYDFPVVYDTFDNSDI
jgi:hypothetical protein